MRLLVTITVAVDALGTTETHLFTDGPGFATLPGDTPANTFVEPRLARAGSFRREMFDGDAMSGAVRAGWGQVELINGDGALDGWAGYGVDGREVKIYASEDGGAFPSAWTLVASVVALSVEVTEAAAIVTLRDRSEELNKPVLTRIFAGTGGLEGDSTLAGKRAARAFDDVLPVPCTLVDAAKLIYHVSEGQSASPAAAIAFDGGVALTMGSTYADLATLQSTAPSAGQARFYGGGPCYVRLGSAPAYEVACAPSQMRTAGGLTTLLGNLAAEAGIAGATGTAVGVQDYLPIDSSDTWQALFARACRQKPSWFGFDALGNFTCGEITDPIGGSPVYEFTQRNSRGLRRTVSRSLPVPAWRVQTRQRRNWIFGRTLAGAAAGYLSREWYFSEVASDSAVLTKHALARDWTIDSPAPHIGAAADFLALFGADRDTFALDAPLTIDVMDAIDIGDVVVLKWSRFGLSTGKKILVIGVDWQLDARIATYTLWG